MIVREHPHRGASRLAPPAGGDQDARHGRVRFLVGDLQVPESQSRSGVEDHEHPAITHSQKPLGSHGQNRRQPVPIVIMSIQVDFRARSV